MSTKPWAYLCPKPTKKSFFATDIKPEDLDNLARNNLGTWAVEKMVLLHKDCPDEVTERYLGSAVWYERLTAALAQGKRAKYLTRLYDDKKSTVRAAAYKTAIIERLDDVQEVCKRIASDEWVKNYFKGFHFWRLEWIKRVAAGEWTIDQWYAASDAAAQSAMSDDW